VAKPSVENLRYALITIGAITTATILRAVIDAVLHEPIHYTTFYLAVMVTALHCGLYWGLASTVLSAIAASMWLPPMGRPLIIEPNDFAGMVLFLVVSVLIVWLSHRMRMHQRVAQQAAEERQELLLREQAARREAERLNHAKDDFLATVSHELRTPLQSILGWVTLLRDFDVDAKETNLAITSIERSVRVQSQLINDLLDLSRIVMGKIRLEPRPVSLVDVVQAAAQTVHPAAQAKNIHIEVERRGESCVLGDSDRLQQVVWNLFSNAIKFTPTDGAVRAVLSQRGDSVELIVTDTGEGIEPELVPYVFERFRQVHRGGSRDGLGLGLAIVKELVELHGGEIQAFSQGKGKGTKFRIMLPKHRPQAVVIEANSPSAERHAVPAVLAGKQVLIVDDDPEARRLIKTVLLRYGVDVLTAESASKASEILTKSKPDIVTCDLDMPGVDGYQFIRNLRRQDRDGKVSLPVIALTASVTEADRRRALENGFQEHLGKPVEPQKLVATLAAVAEDN
jgi:signal transduction histidine kinase/ActR/RegA family two-component response regulator